MYRCQQPRLRSILGLYFEARAALYQRTFFTFLGIAIMMGYYLGID